MRLLCIDFGLKFVGVAVADFPGITARALDTIRADRGNIMPQLAEIIRRESVTRIVIGFPYSDIEGDIHRTIHGFRDEVQSAFSAIPAEYADESYSSQEADELLSETRLGRRKKTRAQDSEAAKIVLLRYLRLHEENY